MSIKTVVLFGQTGASKSSVINLMAGEEKADTSPGRYRCTIHWQEYPIAFDGYNYRVFDTVGLQDPQLGMQEYLYAIVDAHRLIMKLEEEGGIDLLLFCVRAGRFTSTIRNNYRLFYEWLCEKKFPIVLVITGLEREKINMPTKNIILFGETGAGKSSVVNLMAGEDKAETSPDTQRCTIHWKEYPIVFDGYDYRVFDTIGLEEPQLGMQDYLDAIVNAHNLIIKLKNGGGIDLLLFCVRAGRFTATIKNNYRLFYEWLCEKNVPIVLVLTGLKREKVMEDWWIKFGGAFKEQDVIVDGHACITAANNLDGRHQRLYEQSRQLVRKLVREHTYEKSKDGWNVRDSSGWLGRFVRKLTELVLDNFFPKKKAIQNVLTKRCGMPPEAAGELARQVKELRLK